MASSSQKPETFLLSEEAASQLPPQTKLALEQVDALKYFLATAPVEWPLNDYIKRQTLPTGEYVSCILWNNLFHITGTDIVRCLAFRFQAFGRPVKNTKKFEEGIFSDLRNLKAGTDASLEEPKSPFLDFLFKNNCIRTQKKQKVFFWYSVPHDRLFLDALERDLKREKASQETTTTAEREPALSFQFDPSQTLFEQLTKSQQTNNSSFDTVQRNYSRSASPNARLAGSMPPPTTVSQTMHHVPKEALNDMSLYSQPKIPAAVSTPMISTNPMTAVTVTPPAAAVNVPKLEHFYGQGYYDKNGIPLGQATQRHSSVPAFLDYSPAPSFVSNQGYYDDYSTSRGVSYEPMTPPQPMPQYPSDNPYIGADDVSFYTPLSGQQNYGNFTSNHSATPQFGPLHGSVPRQYAMAPTYANADGSPQYKQRRRGSALNMGFSQVASGNIPTSFIRGSQQPTLQSGGSYGAQPYAVRRPSVLRRSVSASVPPDDSIMDSAPFPPSSMTGFENADLLRVKSRGSEPLPSTEQQQHSVLLKHHYANLAREAAGGAAETYGLAVSGPTVFRRARSATLASEMGPYPQKSHSCPIPTCGKLFKRLEHLKRHVRTHTQDRPFICKTCKKAFSRSDNLQQHIRTHETDENGNPLASEDVDEDDGEESTSPAGDDVTDQLCNNYMPTGDPTLGLVNDFSLQQTIAGTMQDMQHMMQSRAQNDLRRTMLHPTQQNLNQNMQQNLQQNMQQNLQQSLQYNVQPNMQSNMQQNQNLHTNIQQSMQQNMHLMGNMGPPPLPIGTMMHGQY